MLRAMLANTTITNNLSFNIAQLIHAFKAQ